MEHYHVANYVGEVSLANSQEIKFYELNEDGTHTNGTTIEAVLRMLCGRLEDLNKKFPCRENSLALTKMQEARLWLEERTADRKRRGVEGKHEA
jgi:hypothetical protein